MAVPQILLDMANHVTELKMFPYFDVAHAVLCCISVREDFGLDGLDFSRRHPLATWVCSLVEMYAGGMLASYFLGEPVLAGLNSNEHLILYSLIWFLMFYCPFDAVYKMCKLLPFKLGFGVMKEIYKVTKIYDGVLHSLKLFPTGYFIAMVIGTVKGNGSGFLKILNRLIRGVWTPGATEILKPSFSMKASMAASFLFIVAKTTTIITFPHSLLYFGIVSFLVFVKVSSSLLGNQDPFLPLESIFCAIFMGGWANGIRKQSVSKAATDNKKSD